MNVQINCGSQVKGTVSISGAKNAIIPLLCASLLAKGKVLFKNVPKITDVTATCEVLRKIGCKVFFKGHYLLVDNTYLKYKPLLFDECIKMRGLYYLIGVFLTLFSKCEIYMPGGCKIGKRPIDIHLKAFEDMGYECVVKEKILKITRRTVLSDINISLKDRSVGATINSILAGLSFNSYKIDNTLLEPEGADVICFLKKIGYPIYVSNSLIQYKKIPIEFKFIKHKVIPDRIETLSYLLLGLLKGEILVKGVNLNHIDQPLNLLIEAGYDIKIEEKGIRVKKSTGKGMVIETKPYPDFPTDMQSIFGVLCACQKESSIIVENIFENRMQIYQDLINSGVNCIVEGNKVTINGGSIDIKRSYSACDLRHGMALILISCIENKKVIIENFDYVLRGYDDIFNKLKGIGIFVKNIR